MMKLILGIVIGIFFLASLTWIGLDNGHKMTKREIREYQRMINNE